MGFNNADSTTDKIRYNKNNIVNCDVKDGGSGLRKTEQSTVLPRKLKETTKMFMLDV
jgi:hypothetical protein